jgi:hypothetical protein
MTDTVRHLYGLIAGLSAEDFKELMSELGEPKEEMPLVRGWKECFDESGGYCMPYSQPSGVFKTLEQRNSAHAYAQLSYIVSDANSRCPEEFEKEGFVWHILPDRIEGVIICQTRAIYHLPLRSKRIAVAMLANPEIKKLWEQFWML